MPAVKVSFTALDRPLVLQELEAARISTPTVCSEIYIYQGW